MDYLGLTALIIYPFTLGFYIYSVRKLRNELKEDQLKDLVIHLFNDQDFQRQLTNAINDSELNKKMDTLITILCTTDDKLKHTKICL